jgi:hypothetical protein
MLSCVAPNARITPSTNPIENVNLESITDRALGTLFISNILNPEFHSGLIPVVPSAQNEIRIPITLLATSEHSYSVIWPKAIPVKALNTAKRNSRFGEISV